MCTAICYRANNGYFGRNLDLEYRYNESVVLTPRNFTFKYKYMPCDEHHFAILGVATMADSYPLYYDGINECGLCIAALNFVGNCVFLPAREGRVNLATFEIIPYILGRCKSVAEARRVLSEINLTNDAFSSLMSPAELHFMLSDKECSVTAEPCKDGFRVYDNTPEVLTNNPTFDYHIKNLGQYMNLSVSEPNADFFKKIKIHAESRGLGGLGLPGDLSSASRFVRAAFVKSNSPLKDEVSDAVNQFFHILSSVSFTEGTVKVGESYERTQYSCCADIATLTYYFKTYRNSRVSSVKMKSSDMLSERITEYPMYRSEDIKELN